MILDLVVKITNRLRFWSIYPFLKRCGSKSIIIKPIILTPEHLELGDRVYIYHHARIQGVTTYEGESYNPKIQIENDVSIQQNLHLTCAEAIIIKKNTAIAANVSITDIDHPYENISLPPERQKIRITPVTIGESCKIYNNVIILPGVKLGNHNIVAANSVVKTGTYPDFCVIAGSPGKVIKKYNQEKNEWIKI